MTERFEPRMRSQGAPPRTLDESRRPDAADPLRQARGCRRMTAREVPSRRTKSHPGPARQRQERAAASRSALVKGAPKQKLRPPELLAEALENPTRGRARRQAANACWRPLSHAPTVSSSSRSPKPIGGSARRAGRLSLGARSTRKAGRFHRPHTNLPGMLSARAGRGPTCAMRNWPWHRPNRNYPT